MGPRLRYFGEVRLTSAPQQISSSLVELTTTFSQLFGQLKPTQIAQSAEYLGGLGFRLTSFGQPFRGSDGAKHRIGLYALVMGGATGFIGDPPTPQIFEAPIEGEPQGALFKALFPKAVLSSAGAPRYVAFAEKDSSRYRKQYFGGARMVGQYTEDAESRGSTRVDFLVGQNEAVTGGTFSGPVIRVEGFVPLAFGGEKAMNNVFYFFGNMQLATNPPFDTFRLDSIRRDFGADRVFLKPAVDIVPSNPLVSVVNTNPLNRDFYRLGVGIDFLRLVKNLQESVGEKVVKLEAPGAVDQKVVIGSKLRTPLRVRAVDAADKIVVGAKLSWTSPDADSNKPTCIFLNEKTVLSDSTAASGLAQATCTANKVSGEPYKVTVVSNNVKHEFTVQNIEPNFTAFGGTEAEQSAPPGEKFPTNLAVEAKDDTGPVAGLEIVFSVQRPEGEFDGGAITVTRITDEKGRAVAPNLIAKGAVGSKVNVTATYGSKTVMFDKLSIKK